MYTMSLFKENFLATGPREQERQQAERKAREQELRQKAKEILQKAKADVERIRVNMKRQQAERAAEEELRARERRERRARELERRQAKREAEEQEHWARERQERMARELERRQAERERKRQQAEMKTPADIETEWNGGEIHKLAMKISFGGVEKTAQVFQSLYNEKEKYTEYRVVWLGKSQGYSDINMHFRYTPADKTVNFIEMPTEGILTSVLSKVEIRILSIGGTKVNCLSYSHL